MDSYSIMLDKLEACPTLRIPPDIQAEGKLLPHENLAIPDLIQFSLPPQLKPLDLGPEDLLSKNPATTSNPQYIKILPIPSRQLLSHLINTAVNNHNMLSVSCPYSVQYQHLRFPLWTITFWVKAAMIRIDHLRPWRMAVDGLGQRREVARMKGADDVLTVIDATVKSLSGILWSGCIYGVERDSLPTSSLTAFLTSEWLCDQHIDILLGSLRNELATELGEDCKIILAPNNFNQKLRKAFEETQKNGTPVAYQTERSFGFIRLIGEDLVKGTAEQLGMIFNIDNNHWVAVVLNFRTYQLYYGDSRCGAAPNSELLELINWWTSLHTNQHFSLQPMATTYQKDGYSCGPLAFNAIQHHVLPGRYPLDCASVATTNRLRNLKDIMIMHNKNVRCCAPVYCSND